jgi:hypothetical protein
MVDLLMAITALIGFVVFAALIIFGAGVTLYSIVSFFHDLFKDGDDEEWD